jgi:hypothetical protein
MNAVPKHGAPGGQYHGPRTPRRVVSAQCGCARSRRLFLRQESDTCGPGPTGPPWGRLAQRCTRQQELACPSCRHLTKRGHQTAREPRDELHCPTAEAAPREAPRWELITPSGCCTSRAAAGAARKTAARLCAASMPLWTSAAASSLPHHTRTATLPSALNDFTPRCAGGAAAFPDSYRSKVAVLSNATGHLRRAVSAQNRELR